MLTPRLAIDLSGSTIRILVGNPGGAMRGAEAPVPPGSMIGGSVVDSGALAPVLRQLVALAGVKESRAMIVASDSLASFRVLSFARDATEPKIDSFVRGQLPTDGARMGLQRHEMTINGAERTVYAVAYDRPKVQALAATVRLAGLEPAVVELKSLCVARVTPQPTCVVLDLTVDPAEVFLIDGSLPRLWHSFKADLETGPDTETVASGLLTVLNFYKRQPSGKDFGPETPVLVAGDQSLPPHSTAAVESLVGHPVRDLPCPPRVAPEIRHVNYLACLGLIMRRR